MGRRFEILAPGFQPTDGARKCSTSSRGRRNAAANCQRPRVPRPARELLEQTRMSRRIAWPTPQRNDPPGGTHPERAYRLPEHSARALRRLERGTTSGHRGLSEGPDEAPCGGPVDVVVLERNDGRHRTRRECRFSAFRTRLRPATARYDGGRRVFPAPCLALTS
jgi:hypothetical protein